MARIRGVHAPYLLAGLLLAATLAVSALGTPGDETGLSRSASVYDQGPGGTAVLRRWLDGLGVRTVALQGDRFAPDLAEEEVLFLLGATEPLTPADIGTLQKFVSEGGTLVVATHDVHLVRESGRRDIVLDHGRVQGDAAPELPVLEARR